MTNAINPDHYKQNELFEVIDITEQYDFCLGNVLKYIFRHKYKNGLEDLKKARWYLDREITRFEGADV